MAYTDVISLANAKIYLGVDDTSRDAEITRMIGSALRYVEEHTNHIMYSRNKNYILTEDNIRVFDYPITAVVKGIDKAGDDVALILETNYDLILKPNCTEYFSIDSDAVQLVLTVGYSSSIPEPLLEGAYMIIEHLFNQKETGESSIPMAAQQLLATHRRFTI